MGLPTYLGHPWFGRGAAPLSGACCPWWPGALSAPAAGHPVLPPSDLEAPVSVGSTAFWLPVTHPAPEK